MSSTTKAAIRLRIQTTRTEIRSEISETNESDGEDKTNGADLTIVEQTSVENDR